MKTGLAITHEHNEELGRLENLGHLDQLGHNDNRGFRPEAASVYDLSVLICQIGEGETRARAANLPLPECRSDTVRQAIQMVIEQARAMINECLARDRQIPWIDPAALPDENESRFVVPLLMSDS